MLHAALEFKNQLLKENFNPTVVTYTILIEATLLQGGIDEAIKLLDEMFEINLQPDVFPYNSIIICAEKNQGKWEAGFELMSDMVAKGCEANVVTYSVLISSLCRDGKVEEGVGLLKDMKKKGLEPDGYCYDPLIAVLCKEGRVDLAIEVLDVMISDGCVPDIVNYNTILACLCKQKRADEALSIFEKLGEVGCSPNASSYNTVFSALGSSGHKVRALGMILEMDGMVDEAIELLVDMEMESSECKPSVVSYNIVLLGLCRVGRVSDATEVLAAMVDKGCLPNETTYTFLIEGIGFGGWLNDARDLATTLVNMDAISEHSFERLYKTFCKLDVYRQLNLSD
ncbi:Pentatricopeptide repeat-containing protein, chloroplastic [Glycine max]|nr:Pentatricopeptide repeat-containing protein, chloroplastic [Glycine max]